MHSPVLSTITLVNRQIGQSPKVMLTGAVSRKIIKPPLCMHLRQLALGVCC